MLILLSQIQKNHKFRQVLSFYLDVDPLALEQLPQRLVVPPHGSVVQRGEAVLVLLVHLGALGGKVEDHRVPDFGVALAALA